MGDQNGLYRDGPPQSSLVLGEEEVVPPAAAGESLDPFWQAAAVPDPLAGMFFWWDAGPPAQKRLYHGRIVATVEGSYILLSFAPHPDLASGLFELVHISRIAEDCWSLFGTEEDYRAALAAEAE